MQKNVNENNKKLTQCYAYVKYWHWPNSSKCVFTLYDQVLEAILKYSVLSQ
jgi:hypothetical protein